MSKRSDLLEAAATLGRAIEEFDPGVLAELERQREKHHEQANAYAATAGVFRRRAAGALAAGDVERAAELERRAAYYDARAVAKGKAVGAPLRIALEAPLMPRRLRTKAESLAVLDEFRRDLAELVGRFADVERDEIEWFGASLAERGDAQHEARPLFDDWQIVIRFSARLGVRYLSEEPDPLARFRYVPFRPPELAEPGENNDTPRAVVPSSHEVPTTPGGGDSR